MDSFETSKIACRLQSLGYLRSIQNNLKLKLIKLNEIFMFSYQLSNIKFILLSISWDRKILVKLLYLNFKYFTFFFVACETNYLKTIL